MPSFNPRSVSRLGAISLIVACAPLLGGAEGDCGPAFARDPAPDMSGAWNISYDDEFTVKVTLGAGAARREYTRTVSATGGTFQVPLTPDGSEMLTFDLDCTRPEVVCPSEVWPTMPSIRQNHPDYTHRIFLQLPTQQCSGNMVAPDDAECGAGTLNPDCEMVCDGDVATVVREAFGTIRDDEAGFDILLGGGVATTAGGVKLIKDENIRDGAGLASKRAAEIYGMHILQPDMQEIRDAADAGVCPDVAVHCQPHGQGREGQARQERLDLRLAADQ